MPIAAKCVELVRKVQGGLEDYLLDPLRGTRRNLGLFFAHKVLKGVDFMKRLGPGGEEIARQLESVVRPAMARRGGQMQNATEALRGLNRKQRRQAAMIADKEIPATGVDPKVRAAAKSLKEILDLDLKAAQSLGNIRRTVDGRKIPLGGSGKSFPTRLNAEGARRVEDAFRNGRASPKVQALIERMVSEGRYATVDDALAALREFREQQLRGTQPYFERERLDLPAELREWDPLAVLPRHFEQVSLFLHGVRRWGADFEGLHPMLARVSRESGEAEAKMVENFIRTQFGIDGSVPRFDQKVYGAISNYETVAKLTGLFSPVLNFGQRFVNTADAPLSAQVKAAVKLPPGLNAFLPGARKIKDQIRRSGAISGINPITELSAQGGRFTKALLTPFIVVARGNEFHSALVARYALESDITALDRLSGRESGIGKILDMLRDLSVDPEGSTRRAIARRGLDPDEALAKFRKGERMTAAEWAPVLQRAAEDDQFALNILTEPIWWQTNPFLRLVAKFKPFTVRQTGLIWNRILGEARLGNFAPLVKFLGAAAIMGEAYHLAKDVLSGRDDSVTSLLSQGDPSKRTVQQVSARLLSNIAAQGGFGVLADVDYGITNFVIGPAGSSIQTMLDAGAHLNQDPTQVGTVIREVVNDEIVLARQIERLYTQATQSIDDDPRFRNYHRLRSAAFDYRQAKESPGAGAKLKDVIERALAGTTSYPVTERTLRYRYAARAITASDTEKASEYLAEIFATAEDRRGVIQLAQNARRSMMNQAPMGNLNEADRAAFLRDMSPERRAPARRLRVAWLRDYTSAINTARTAAIRQLGG